MKWFPYGPNAWLVQFADRIGDDAFAKGRAIAAELERHPPPGLVEFVPAFTTGELEFAVEQVDNLFVRMRMLWQQSARPDRPVRKRHVRRMHEMDFETREGLSLLQMVQLNEWHNSSQDSGISHLTASIQNESLRQHQR
ncbi:MAG: hypothetical protein DME26_11455 [Verrucomicrobia bacterium]|nr:MAG: hypothetical protein DME26_11455 [Verrucomicrobiota bacterium]